MQRARTQKLTDEQVASLLADCKTEMTRAEIAAKYGVSKSYVSHLFHWGRVKNRHVASFAAPYRGWEKPFKKPVPEPL